MENKEELHTHQKNYEDKELKKRVERLLNEGKRSDGRTPHEYREPVNIEQGTVETAEGSAEVTIGDTKVIAGVKLSVDEPYPDSQDEGSVMVSVELRPTAHGDYETGPPGPKAVELSRVIDRGIRESDAVDFKELCINEGEDVWTVGIDIVPVNDDGNLFDAGALAAIAALRDTNFVEYNDGKVEYKKQTDEEIPLEKEPLATTVYKVGDHHIIDPTKEEENVYDARLTVASLEDGTITALQKGGSTPLPVEEVQEMVDLALEKTKVLRKEL